MRRSIEEKFLRLIRLYTLNTPISKGKYRLFQLALRMCGLRHERMPVRLPDGRCFSVDLSTGMQDTVFFLGEFEPVLSGIAEKLIGEGDVCIDAGANFGWYTSLMALNCGGGGQVHSFEPMETTFRELERNIEIMGSPSNVVINNAALGNRRETVQIHLFDGLPNGHASLAPKKEFKSTTFNCEMRTLDEYLVGKGIDRVDFVKADIEGAELMLLKGAERLFEHEHAPIILMEMAVEHTSNFDYHPNDLIHFIGSRASYEFFAVDEYRGTVKRIREFASGEPGANVFCIPTSAASGKMAVVTEKIE